MTIKVNNSEIIYKNTIVTQNISMFGLINRHRPVHIDFSCYYSQPDIESMAIRLKHRCVMGVQYVAQKFFITELYLFFFCAD